MATYTLESVETTILDNAAWYQNRSITEAKAFASAVTRWLFLSPSSSSNQSSSLSWDVATAREELAKAQSYISQNDTSDSGGRVRFLGVGSNFRG